MDFPDALIPLAVVIERSGLSQSEVYRLQKLGQFPRAAKNGTSARWSQNEVAAWIETRLAERSQAS